MPKCWMYVRVSSDRQADGASPDTQRKKLIALAAEKCPGLPVEQMDEGEGVSAFKLEFHQRPAGSRLLLLAGKGDVVMFSRIDRACRNLRDMLNTIHTFEAAGVRVLCPDMPNGEFDTTSPNGKVLMTMYGLMAEMESDRNRQRLLDSAAGRRQSGMAIGRSIPAGFRQVSLEVPRRGRMVSVRFLYPDAPERRLMTQMLDWANRGWTTKAISDHLYRHRVRLREQYTTRDQIFKYLKAERNLRVREAQAAAEGYDLAEVFVTPFGFMVPFARFTGKVQPAEAHDAKTWRLHVKEPTPAKPADDGPLADTTEDDQDDSPRADGLDSVETGC